MPKTQRQKKATQKRITQIETALPIAALGPPPTPPRPSATEQGKFVDLSQAKTERRQINVQERKDRRAAANAARMIRRGLAQAKRELSASGLTGTELTEAMKEYTARQVDAVGGARLQQTAIRKEADEDRTELTQEIGSLRAETRTIRGDLQAQAQEESEQYQGDVLEARLKSEKARLEAAGEGGMTPAATRAQKQSRKIAAQGVTTLLDAIRAKKPEKAPRSDEEWRQFALAADDELSGTNLADINFVIAKLRKRVRATNPIGRKLTPF